MPELSSPIFSEADDANATPPPNGFPEGMAFSGVNDSARAVMGAMKRFWGRIQGAYASTGSANAYVVTPAQSLAAYVAGERYSFRANFTNTGGATLKLSALGAKTIKKMTAAGKADLASGDIQPGQPVTVEYDGTDMVMVTPTANTIDDSTKTVQAGFVDLHSGFRAPTGWVFAFGQELSRTDYAALFAATTEVQTGTLTSGSATVTGLPDTSILGVGMKVEGTGISAGTTIASIVSSTSITLSANATTSGSQSLRFFAHGNGDGSTTFNVVDMRGYVPAGRDNMGGAAAGRLVANVPNGIIEAHGQSLGRTGGAATHSLTEAELAPHTHSYTHVVISGSGVAGFGGVSWGPQSDTTGSSGNGSAHNNLQPTIVLNFVVKT